MFRNVPACSGMFRDPGFIDALFDVGLMDIPKAFGWSLNDLILRSLVELELLLLLLLLLLF